MISFVGAYSDKFKHGSGAWICGERAGTDRKTLRVRVPRPESANAVSTHESTNMCATATRMSHAAVRAANPDWATEDDDREEHWECD